MRYHNKTLDYYKKLLYNSHINTNRNLLCLRVVFGVSILKENRMTKRKNSKSNNSTRNQETTTKTQKRAESTNKAEPVSKSADFRRNDNEAREDTVVVPTLESLFARSVKMSVVVFMVLTLLLANVVSYYVGSNTQVGAPGVEGVAATVNGTEITFEELKNPADPDQADNMIAAEAVINKARQKVFKDYMDEQNVPIPTTEQFEAALPSYIGTQTIAAAAESYRTTEEALKEDLMFDLRMNNFRKEFTGFKEDPPPAPTDFNDQEAMAAYQTAMADFNTRAAPSNEKWNELLRKVFSDVRINLNTLTTGQ